MIVEKKVKAHTRRLVSRDTRNRAVTFRAFPQQVDAWFAVAEREQMSLSAWIARTLDAAAQISK